MRQSIEIHIDELVLHGFPSHHRYIIGEILQAELQNLFTTAGIPPELLNGSSSSVIDAGSFSRHPSTKPESIGKSIANSVYNSFSNGK